MRKLTPYNAARYCSVGAASHTIQPATPDAHSFFYIANLAIGDYGLLPLLPDPLEPLELPEPLEDEPLVLDDELPPLELLDELEEDALDGGLNSVLGVEPLRDEFAGVVRGLSPMFAER